MLSDAGIILYGILDSSSEVKDYMGIRDDILFENQKSFKNCLIKYRMALKSVNCIIAKTEYNLSILCQYISVQYTEE
jgi:hypothetical protein